MDMVKRLYIVVVALLAIGWAGAQEVLLPLQSANVVPTAKDGTDSAIRLPFFDDFSHPTDRLQSTLWEPCGATVGTGYGELPPTIGMATLDAIDADGNLYPQASTTPFPADTLLSRSIRLDSVNPQDSLVLSFFYLPGGGYGNLWERVGDTPDPADSIYLDIYSAPDSTWHTVWTRGGISVDTLMAQTGSRWQYVAIAITDSIYFDSMFRFRFRNHCSLDATSKKGLKGNCDQWNIDYLLLDTGRSVNAAPVWRDVAFAEEAPSLLATYQAMPARQYRPSDMAQNIQLYIANLYNSDLATHYGYSIVDETGDTVYHYDGGFENAPAGGIQESPAHANPTIGYAFPTDAESHTYEIVHTIREGVGGDSRGQNDTTRFFQVFGDYYAYDDGKPENGYGLTSTASRVYLAYRFDLNEADTLTAVDLYFNRTANHENESIGFYLTVWQAGADGRPGEVVYRDNERRYPQFGGMNTYSRYTLEHATLIYGSVFVGFEQVGNDYINLGFDRNHQSADRIWYLTSTEWQQSILRGSLMLRPCFGADAVGTISTADDEHITLRPNPANRYFEVDAECRHIAVYNQQGVLVHEGRGRRVDTSNMPSGFYIVRLITEGGAAHTEKMIIRH